MKRGSDQQKVTADVERRLYHYINPVRGGVDGQGWPFGRSLSLSEMHAALQGIENVDYIEDVKLFPIDPDTDERRESTTRVTITPNSVLSSHNHEVMVME